MPCVYVFKRGQRAGQQCGKEKCKEHEKRIFELQKLPPLVLTNIFKNYLKYHKVLAFNHLLILSQTCKEFNQVIQPIWELLYEKIHVTDYEENCMSQLSYLDRLHLLIDRGCQRCHNPFTKKIHWPYTIRLCHDCFKKVSITPYQLKVKYNIIFMTDKVFVLRSEIERLIQCKLEEYHLNDYKRYLAQELDLPINALTKYSRSYLKKQRPNPMIVLTEYYKNLAYEQFNSHLKSLRLFNKYFPPFSKEVNKIYNIKNKQDYEEWHSNLHTYKARYDENVKIRRYNDSFFKKKSQLELLLNENQYYRSIGIDQIPEIKEIITKYNDPKNDIKEMEEAMQKASDILKKFMLDNQYKPLFENKKGNKIVESILRYPDTKLKHQDYRRFINEFSRVVHCRIVITDENLKTLKWEELVELVDDYFL